MHPFVEMIVLNIVYNKKDNSNVSVKYGFNFTREVKICILNVFMVLVPYC